MTKNNNKLLIINQFFPPDFASTGQLLESISKFISAKNIDVEILTTIPNYSNLKSKPLKNEKGNLMVRRFNTLLVSKGIVSKLILEFSFYAVFFNYFKMVRSFNCLHLNLRLSIDCFNKINYLIFHLSQ